MGNKILVVTVLVMLAAPFFGAVWFSGVIAAVLLAYFLLLQ